MMTALGGFLIAFVLVLVSTPVAGRVATHFGIIDKPDGALKQHRKPTPYLGGVAIFIAAVIPMVSIAFGVLGGTESGLQLAAIAAGGTIILFLGIIDDVKVLPPGTKFLGQFVAATFLVVFGVKLRFVENGLMAIPLTLVWVVGVTNAFNIIDIMDGLSAGVGCIASTTFVIVAALTGQDFVTAGAASLAGACFGFLFYNYAPARIFMGDAGSQFIGFTLSALAIGQSYTMTNHVAFFVPILILAVPIFDTVFVSVARLSKGLSPFRGSPDHFAIRLERLGLARRTVVLLAWVCSAILGAVSVVIVRSTPALSAALYAASALFLLGAAVRLWRIRV